MVLPLIPALAGHALRFGITSSSLRSAGGTFAQSLPFGAGYSFGTYVGFPKNYESKRNYRKSYKSQYVNMNKMPFGSPYGYARRRYSRYGRRYGRRYNRYGSRYSRYGRRSYYGRRYY